VVVFRKKSVSLPIVVSGAVVPAKKEALPLDPDTMA
jgi:hypothetical protein